MNNFNFNKNKIRKNKPILFGIGFIFIIATIIGISIIHISKAKEVEFISYKDNFKADENLLFKFKYRGDGNYKDLGIKVTVFDYKGNQVTQINPQLEYGENEEISVDLTKYFKEIKPGKYRLKFEIEDKNNGKTYVENKDFTWGVLAINVNKSIYLPGEKAYLQFAVLKDDGHTVCDANLKLKIKNQKSKLETELSTANGTIEYSGKCGPDNVTDVPDYFAYYSVQEAGIYQMKLTNLDNSYEIEDSFEVRDSVPFDIERIGPTRIYPPAEYQITLRVKVNQDFVGEVVEYMPERFEIKNQNAKVKTTNQNSKSIIWNVNWKKDEIHELKYTFDAPDISPYLYLLGPLELFSVNPRSNQRESAVFAEQRQWQIATDSPNTRAKTATFLVGQYSGTGSAGQNGAASWSFSQFDIELADTTASIKSAFIIFEAQINGINDAGDITGWQLAFDACSAPCTADAWGSDNVSQDQGATMVVEAETTINSAYYVRILFDVTSETQLNAYTGGGGAGDGAYLSAALGYWIDAATNNTSLINSAEAKLVITYTYNDTGNSMTNTVIYPLKSNASTDIGSRQTVVDADCVVNSTCPLFNYNMDIAEYSQRLSQWFEVGGFNDVNSTRDVRHYINIQGDNASSSLFVLEAAQGGAEGNWSEGWYSGVSGFAENTAQQLEHYFYTSTNTDDLYLIGGEVFETYTASASGTRTKTVSYPIGVITDGSTQTGAEASTTVFFPETVASIKSAWFRIIVSSSDADASATLAVSYKVGDNTQSASMSYAFNSGGTVITQQFKIFDVIASSEYDELDNANGTTGKIVDINVDSSVTTTRAISAELMITYTYTSETGGYMTSLNLYGGQTTGAATSTLSEDVSTANSVLPETTGTKAIRGAVLRSSYLLSDSDGVTPAGPGNVDNDLSTSAPTCNATHDTDADDAPAFIEIYDSVSSAMNTDNNQTYTACYAIDRHGDADTGGAKMNGILIYTYQWDAPVSVDVSQAHFRWRNDDGSESAATWKRAEDYLHSGQAKSQNVRLRFSVKNTGGTASGYQFELQVAAKNNSATCEAVASTSYSVVTTTSGAGCGSSVACMTTSANFANGDATTNQLTSEGTFVAGKMVEDPSNISGAITINQNYFTEAEYNFQMTTYSSNNGAYCFRVTNNGALLDTYTKVAEITIEPGVLQFLLKGGILIKGGATLK